MTPTNEQLLALLANPESDRLEHTVSESDSDKFGEAICAFANDLPGSGEPGFLCVGIDDDRRAPGVRDPERVEQAIAALRDNGNILPPPVLTIRRLRSPEGATIVIAIVKPSDRPPVRYRGRTAIRIGARRGYATLEEERRLAERAIGASLTWDMQPCADADLSDLALDLFTLNYLPQAISAEVLAANGRPAEEQLAALRFFDLRTRHPTNGAVLLFGKDPLRLCPGAYAQYVRYDGEDKASEVLEERRISGDLGTIMRELDVLTGRLAGARPIAQPDQTDRTVFNYPPRAMHELLMNAVIHRNYEHSTTPITIDHYSDRIEIMNPGSLFGGLSPDIFPRGTAYRNPLLAEAAKVLGFVNRFGRGIEVANGLLIRNGGSPAEFQPATAFFFVLVRQRLGKE